jgi:hypothetical protein
MTLVQLGKEAKAEDDVESILYVQAKEAAIRKRLINTGSVHRSFDTGFCENIALDMPQVRSGRVRYSCDGVAMSQQRQNAACCKGADLGGVTTQAGGTHVDPRFLAKGAAGGARQKVNNIIG